MRIDKERYFKNISERLENINYGSYEVDNEYGEDYFGISDNKYEIMKELNNIIPNSELNENQMNNIQSLIDDVNINLSQPVGYQNFRMFYKEEDKLGNVIWTSLENYIIKE